MREDVMSENMTDDTTTEVQSEALKVRIARGTLLTVARWRQPQYAGLLTNQNTRVALVWGPSCCGRSFHCTWVVEQPVTNVFPARGQRICLYSFFVSFLLQCMFLPERAASPLQNPGASWEIVVLFRSLLSLRRICLKRLSGLRLPRFGIRVSFYLPEKAERAEGSMPRSVASIPPSSSGAIPPIRIPHAFLPPLPSVTPLYLFLSLSSSSSLYPCPFPHSRSLTR